jgi:uncharacterized membrane protein
MTNVHFERGAISAGECVSNGWELIKQNYGMYLGIAVISIILAGCIPCVSLFMVGPVLGGVYFVLLRNISGEPVDFGMMFRGFEKFVPLMVIGIIQSIPEIIGQTIRIGIDIGNIFTSGGIGQGSGDGSFFQTSSSEFMLASGTLVVILIAAFAIMLFAIAWRILLFFAIPLAMEHDLGVVDSMKLSVQAAIGNLGGLIVLFLLEVLIALLGVVLCIVGLFFISIPLIYAANAFAYRQVFPRADQPFTNMAPPPPGAYGANYGQAI